MIRDIPIKFLLLSGVLISGLIPLLVVALIGYSTAKNELRTQAFRQLESVRDIKKNQILSYFNERFADITVFAQNPYIASACREIDTAFAQCGGVAGGHFHGFSHGRYTAPESFQRVHNRYFPFLHALITAYGYYDLFLMNSATGDTFFTIEKEADFGIRAAAIASPLHDVWLRAVQQRHYALSDTQPYSPSGNSPAQFLAAPVWADNRVVGVIAVQISIAAIDRIMNERSGMWNSGETYLVGTDKKMRSDSSLDRINHSVAASFMGTTRQNGIDTIASQQALRGITATGHILNYHGDATLSAYTLVGIADVRWALIAEIAEKEINLQIAQALNGKIAILFALTLVLLTLISMMISVFISRGIRHIVWQLEKMLDDVLRGILHTHAEPEEVGIDFRRVAEQTNALIAAFAAQSEETRKLQDHMQYTARLEAIGALAGGIAHDFNNILTALYAYAHLLACELSTAPTAQSNLSEMVAVIHRASGLVQQILTFSRQVKIEKQMISVTDTVLEVVKLLRVTLPQKIVIVCQLNTPHSMIHADPLQIHQILMNLCTNAFHAMPNKGGTLTVSSMEVASQQDSQVNLAPGRYVKLSISDTGSGIRDEILPHIFEPFFTTKPAGHGTGLGLTIVRGIVQNCGGAITVASRYAEGSTFHVFLPLAQPVESLKPENAPTTMPRPAIDDKSVILFVDDDNDLRRSMKKALQEAGMRVETAKDGLAARNRFNRSPNRYGIVVTDLNMPRCGGLDFASAIRRKRPDLPIILTTGFAELISEELIQAAGIKELLLKPFTVKDLIAAISRCLWPSK